MADQKTIKEQRDLFLAFAFASADLFLEVGEDGYICFTSGAAISITGIDHKTLMGRKWIDIFAKKDKISLAKVKRRATEGQRSKPMLVSLNDQSGQNRDAILTAIKMPESGSFYIALSFPSEMMIKLAGLGQDESELSLLDKDAYMQAAQEAFDFARTIGEGIEMTLLDIPRTETIREKIGDDKWGNFTESVTQILCENSIDGTAAAMINEGRYSVIHDQEIDSETIRQQIELLGIDIDHDAEGFEINSKTVSADLESLSERETTKALVYTINEFERKGANLNIDTLNSSFKAYVSANAQKIHQFKTMVEQLNFDIVFQPIVDLESLALSHFEILSKFKGEGSTQEWIIFGEDIGMAAELDIAVCERVMNYLKYKGSSNRFKFAVNLSGQSMQNEQFFQTLLAKLDMNPEFSSRMYFEITESTTMQNLEMVNNFIEVLQERGYKVCLDDFGAGTASFKYIQQLHVDFIKIDGLYTNKILTSHRDQVLVKNLAQMSKDLGIGVISERIETQEQKEMMEKLGVSYGQGYYFGKLSNNPEFDPAKVGKQK